MTKEERKVIKSLSKCDFTEMHKYFVEKSEERKNKSKEEKQVRWCQISSSSSGDWMCFFRFWKRRPVVCWRSTDSVCWTDTARRSETLSWSLRVCSAAEENTRRWANWRNASSLRTSSSTAARETLDTFTFWPSVTDKRFSVEKTRQSRLRKPKLFLSSLMFSGSRWCFHPEQRLCRFMNSSTFIIRSLSRLIFVSSETQRSQSLLKDTSGSVCSMKTQSHGWCPGWRTFTEDPNTSCWTPALNSRWELTALNTWSTDCWVPAHLVCVRRERRTGRSMKRPVSWRWVWTQSGKSTNVTGPPERWRPDREESLSTSLIRFVCLPVCPSPSSCGTVLTRHNILCTIFQTGSLVYSFVNII